MKKTTYSLFQNKPVISHIRFLLNSTFGMNTYRESSYITYNCKNLLDKRDHNSEPFQKLNYLFQNLIKKYKLKNIKIKWISKSSLIYSHEPAYICLEYNYIYYFFELLINNPQLIYNKVSEAPVGRAPVGRAPVNEDYDDFGFIC